MTDAAFDDAHRLSGSDPVWRMLTGAAAFGAGVFVCGAVGSYAPTDPSLNVATDAAVSNLFGPSGAAFADIARQSLGWSGWVGGLALMVGGAMRASLTGRPNLRRWLLGCAFVPLSAACFASWPLPASWPLATGLGGVIGAQLHDLASMPFRALMLPAPETFAGVVLGMGALWASLNALGFRRYDAQLLQDAAAQSSLSAARRARGLGGAIMAIRDRIFKRPEAPAQPFAVSVESTPRTRADSQSGRILIPESDDYDFDTSDYTLPPEDDEPEIEVPQPRSITPVPGSLPTRGVQTTQRPTPPSPPAPRPRVLSSKLPPIDLLNDPPPRQNTVDEDALLAKAARLAEVLNEFGVRGRIKEVRPGPVVTLFEMEPAPGVKSARVISLADDIARSMSATSARVAVVPGKNAIGIELPNEERETVYFRTLLNTDPYRKSKASLPMALGEDIGGTPNVVDLAKMPHLLIAGTTGSGKSVGVNAMILSLMYKLTPEECRFIMIDPKMLELSIYEGIPHLLAPVVTDPKKAVNALKWAVREMEQRYELMSKAGVRNLKGFNDKAAKFRERGDALTRKVQTGFDDAGKPIHETEVLPTEHIPNIVVVIDEMADLMMVAGKEIEGCIQRLAQMARAAGIHLITATQRPSVDVITGTIKANFPTRISYMVTTKIDSRTILGEQGAEQLLGMGDLLYQAPGGKTKRMHGPFVSDEEVENVVGWLRDQGEPNYCLDVLEEAEEDSPIMDAMLGNSTGDAEEDLYAQAIAIVVRDDRASTSYLQRRLKIGYNKAASLIERLEEEGVVSAPNHAGKRDVLAKRDPSAES
ncbi:MAG: DNA translocase FtsK [Pseudomonadota bacterium]